jgi:Spy/CpxP family protein refolding chaperone
MNYRTCLFLLVIGVTTASWAQPPGPVRVPSPVRQGGLESGPTATELIERNFFEPELIMRNQKALGLTGEQQKSIREEVAKTMPRFTELRWQQSAETEVLIALFNQDRPDEKQVLAQLEKLLGIENEIKRLHAGLLVRIRNELTAEQQAQLRAIKNKGNPGPARR